MKNRERTLLADFVREHKMGVSMSFLFAVGGSIINIFIPLSIGYFQSLYAGGEGGKLRLLHGLGLHIEHTDDFFLFFSALVALRFALAWSESLNVQRVGEQWSAMLRERLFGSQLAQSPMVFGRKHAGQYLLRFASDLSSTRNLVTKGLIKGAADITMIVMALLLFFWMDALLGLVTLLFLALVFPIIVLTARVTGKRHAAAADMRSGLMRVVSDTYYGFVSIKALNGEKRRLKEFRKKSAQLLERSSETANWTALEQALTEILSFVSIGLVLFLSAKYHSVSYSNGMLLSVILVLLYMRGPLRRLLRLPSIYAKGQNALTKVCVLLSLPVELSSGDELCKKELISIRFENLVLIEGHKPLSTVLPPGSLVQISGPHGSGKSRLLACLLQLDEPCAGSIYIGDENLAATPPFQTRRRIALVSDLLLPEGNTVAEFIRAEGTEQRRLAAREWYNHFCESFSLVQGSDTFESWCRTDVSALSDTHIRLLKVIRAFLSGKKIICIDGQFVHFSNEELEQLARFIEAMKGKRTFVIASQSLPPGLQPDFHIQLS